MQAIITNKSNRILPIIILTLSTHSPPPPNWRDLNHEDARPKDVGVHEVNSPSPYTYIVILVSWRMQLEQFQNKTNPPEIKTKQNNIETINNDCTVYKVH